ncbi:MAG: TolC family protein [Deferribacteres bacterium]|nr:TolC family protein [candidate division KSB1 bacterium]MCB9502810.1 TolC family protein [Deferribacteres bacterium]
MSHQSVLNAVIITCAFGMFTNPVFSQNQPLTLEQCVKMAQDKNSQIAASRYQVKIAESNVTTQRSALLPSISASLYSGQTRVGPSEYLDRVPTGLDANGNVTYDIKKAVSDEVHFNSNNMSFRLSQQLFDFGQTYNNIKQSTANKDATEMALESTVQSTIYNVHNAYYSLLKAQQLVEVYEESVKQYEEQLKRTESMYEIGSVAQADVYRSQSTLGREKISLLGQKAAVEEARTNLNIILGNRADTPLEVVDMVDIGQARAYNLEEVLNRSLAANPDIQRYKSEMIAATHGRKSAKYAFLPTLSASASYGRRNDQLERVYTGFDKDWTISFGISLDYNLFSGFRDAASVDRQTYNYRISAENLDYTERDIKRKVINALNNLEAYRQIANINQSNLLSSKEDLRLAQERYRVGAGTLLDVLTAQANLTSAKSTLVRAKYDMKIYEAQLASLTGELK